VMSENFTVKISGLSELEDALAKLGNDEAKAIIKDGLKAGAACSVKSICDTAPSGATGDLKLAKNWKVTTSIKPELLAGRARIKPTGKEEHERIGRGRSKTNDTWRGQPKGKPYHRSHAYIVKLMEFGSALGATVRKFPVMTAGFASGANKSMDAIVDTIKDRLSKYGLK